MLSVLICVAGGTLNFWHLVVNWKQMWSIIERFLILGTFPPNMHFVWSILWSLMLGLDNEALICSKWYGNKCMLAINGNECTHLSKCPDTSNPICTGAVWDLALYFISSLFFTTVLIIYSTDILFRINLHLCLM